MKKDKKNADKMNDEPKDVIDFINNCFTKKPLRQTRPVQKKVKDAAGPVDVVGPVDDAGPVDAGVDAGPVDDVNDVNDVDIKKVVATKSPKKCKDGKVLNPKTGRCVLNKAGVVKSPKKCKDGKVLNPKTGRCVIQKERDADYSF